MTDDQREATFEDGAQGPRKVTVNYPSNSNREKAERQKQEQKPEKRVEKVISGEVVQRKKGLGRKIADTFTGDSLESVGNYVLFDVVLPQIRALFVDVVTQGMERKFLGSSRPRTSSPASRGVTHVSYNRMSSPAGRAGEADGTRSISARSRSTHDFDEIIIADRGEADYVIETLQALIDQYRVASVADLYDLVGITSNFTDQKWGWSHLRGAGVIRARDGYILNLPPTENIDA